MTPTEQLRNAGRTPRAPLTLALEAGELQIEAWLRILPGKRLVGHGRYRGERVLAKLFVGDRAARHVERERAGIQALAEAQVPTPRLVKAGPLPGGGAYLLSEFLPQAVTLQELWDQLPARTPGEPAAMALLSSALRMIAAMHARGLVQGDLHLGNFLRSGDDLLVIDGDAVQSLSPGEPLAEDAVERNLGLFFAQLPPAWDALMEPLLVDYLMGNAHGAVQPERIRHWLIRSRAERLSDYLDKTLRDCSLFAVERSWRRFTVVLRTRRDGLAELVAEPDQAFGGALIKDGGSSTVAKWSCPDGDLLIKRYNLKGLMHWLRRFWRPSRAWHAWQAGHRLRFLGLATPEPLAMIESRFGPLRRRAWLITRFAPGRQLLDVLGDGSHLPDAPLAEAIVTTFRGLHQARISHGDCKATNFLWDGQDLIIIDLDAMQAHAAGAAWERAWAADRNRLLRNWPAASPLAAWLDEQLPR